MFPSVASRRMFLTALIALHLLLITLAVPVSGDVAFYFQREGSPDDVGEALFGEEAGALAVQDFEDPELGPDGADLTVLPVGDVEFGLSAAYPDGEPFMPFKWYVPSFYFEDKLYATVLVSFSSLTFTPQSEQPVRALGAWVYDDGGALDSAYRIDVAELDGATSHAVLENEIPLDGSYHEIEGFFGVVSDVGIAEVTITAIDPVSGEANPDTFEVDHVRVAEAPVVDESDSPCVNPRGKPLHRHRRHKCTKNSCGHRPHRVKPGASVP